MPCTVCPSIHTFPLVLPGMANRHTCTHSNFLFSKFFKSSTFATAVLPVRFDSRFVGRNSDCLKFVDKCCAYYEFCCLFGVFACVISFTTYV